MLQLCTLQLYLDFMQPYIEEQSILPSSRANLTAQGSEKLSLLPRLATLVATPLFLNLAGIK